jgi:hypothetical protein
MEKTIFYSWQSDLPNNKNRGFIGGCIEQAVKSIQVDSIHLEVAVDRDTKGISGTPDIASTIFSKIDNTTIFIADISFINPNSPDRKCPNPNVLVELGYAAKTIGWNNIICVFNTEFGIIEDLPFDLRFRRPLTYQITNTKNKTADRKSLTERIKKEILSVINHETNKDEIRIYIKQQVDKQILGICNHLFKIFHGYETSYTFSEVDKLISYSLVDIQKSLFERKFLGFTVLKDWSDYKQKLEDTMNQPFFTQNAEPNYVSSLIKVIRGIEMLTTVCGDHKLFIDTGKIIDGYKVIDGTKMNPDNPKDSFLLLKIIGDNDNGIVIDFGVIRKYNTQRLLNLQSIKGERFSPFVMSIHETLKAIDNWTKNTGNHLIIDPLTFRIHGSE